MNTEDIAYYMQQEREKLLSDMGLYIQYLIKGTNFCFAQIPSNDKTATLLGQLKEYGFISIDTTIEHFRVIFGIPLHKSNTPFKPIRWEKDRQLLRYFMYTLFPNETLRGMGRYTVPHLFADKHGEPMTMPQSDKKRLEGSPYYDTLNTILTNFNK